MDLSRHALLHRAKDVEIALRRRLSQNQRLRAFRYRFTNQGTFSNLYLHDAMLADSVRMGTYHAGITKHIQPAQTVVDVGTGSGVLAFMAAQRGAYVHAIDHASILEAAEAVAAGNGIRNVQFHRTHSAEFHLPERVDAIIHEQIGGAVFDERMVDTISELRDRLLKPGGAVHPAHFDMYIEPVELREDARIPFAWDQKLYGVDYRELRRLEESRAISTALRESRRSRSAGISVRPSPSSRSI